MVGSGYLLFGTKRLRLAFEIRTESRDEDSAYNTENGEKGNQPRGAAAVVQRPAADRDRSPHSQNRDNSGLQRQSLGAVEITVERSKELIPDQPLLQMGATF